jgi:hypothetical protein
MATAGETQRDQSQRQNIPIPDPTVLTTEALRREIDHLRELLEAQLSDIAQEVSEFKRNHEEKHRDVVEAAVRHLDELCAEKFAGVQRQFDERDVRTEQAFKASTEAVTAALAAAKEAVGKSELATTKQIDSIQLVITTAQTATNASIQDIKDRVIRAEGSLVGEEKKSSGLGQAASLGLAAVGVLVSIVSVVAVILVATGR